MPGAKLSGRGHCAVTVPTPVPSPPPILPIAFQVLSSYLIFCNDVYAFLVCSTESSKKKPPIYKVMLHNDNYNRREYVVKILLKNIEGLTVDDAVNVMQVSAIPMSAVAFTASIPCCLG